LSIFAPAVHRKHVPSTTPSCGSLFRRSGGHQTLADQPHTLSSKHSPQLQPTMKLAANVLVLLMATLLVISVVAGNSVQNLNSKTANLADLDFEGRNLLERELASRGFSAGDFFSLFKGVSFGCGLRLLDPSLIGALISCHMFDLLSGLSISLTAPTTFDANTALKNTLPDVCTSSCSASINTFADRVKDACDGQSILDIEQVLQSHAGEISPAVLELLKPLGTKFTSEDVRGVVLGGLTVACQTKSNPSTASTDDKWCILEVGNTLGPVISNLTAGNGQVDIASVTGILSDPQLLCQECVPKSVAALQQAANQSRIIGAYKNYIDIASSLVNGRCLPGGGSKPNIASTPNVAAFNGSCPQGAIGPNCEVCQTDSVCAISEPGVCSTSPVVIEKSNGLCNVNEPTLKAIFPGQATGVFTRILPSDASASVYLDGALQFTCSLSQCKSESNSQTDKWNCPAASCKCETGAAMCGKPGAIVDLTGPLSGIKGPFTLSCDLNNPTCAFEIADIAGLFPQGIVLDGCVHGECLRGEAIQKGSSKISGLAPPPAPTNVALIVGATLGGLVAAVGLGLCIFGCVQRSKLQKGNVAVKPNLPRPAVLEFSNVEYSVPVSNGLLSKCLPHEEELDDSDSISEFSTVSPGKKPILCGISGKFSPGLTCIIGASGSGKSSLLDILAGCEKSGAVSGSLTLNGIPATPKDLKQFVGYIVQDDLFPAYLTVRECIEFSAKTRLPETTTKQEMAHVVDKVLEMTGLASIQTSKIGDPSVKSRSGKSRGISGGQRRRVSVACELVTHPALLLLDEPTSGLDSHTAYHLVKALKEMSTEATIALTIHQPPPQVFALFDHVILMIPGGRILWQGKPSEAQAFLTAVDPTGESDLLTVADRLMDVSVVKGREILASTPQRFDSMDKGLQVVSSEQSLSTFAGKQAHVSALTQLFELFSRSIKTLLRDPSLLTSHWIISVGLGLLVGGFYFQSPATIAGFQNKLGASFFLLAIMAFSSLSAVGGTMSPPVRSQFIRERTGSWYRVWTWSVSRLMIDLIPLRIVPALVMGSIAYWMIGMVPAVSNFIKFLAVVVLFSTSVGGFALCVSALISDYGTASLVVAVCMLFQMLLGGLLINTNSIPPALSWIQWLSLFRYATEALAVNEAASSRIVDTLQGIPVDLPASSILGSLFGFDMDSFYRNVFALLGWSVALSLVFLGLVQWRVKEKR
jgi:ABC-type multidrug transport system ATPase subunit/ABC-type multidrug transport system permease subunit